MAAPAAGFKPQDNAKVAANAAMLETLAVYRNDPKNAEELAGIPADAAEEVLYSDIILKVNRFGMRQSRCVVVTSFALLNFKPKQFKSWQRRVPITMMEELWRVDGTCELSTCLPGAVQRSLCCPPCPHAPCLLSAARAMHFFSS